MWKPSWSNHSTINLLATRSAQIPQDKVCYHSMSLYCIRKLYCHKLCLQDHNSGTRLTMKWCTLYLLYINCNVLPPFVYVGISVPTFNGMRKHIVKVFRSVHSNGFLFGVLIMEKAHESGGPLVTVESFHARPWISTCFCQSVDEMHYLCLVNPRLKVNVCLPTFCTPQYSRHYVHTCWLMQLFLTNPRVPTNTHELWISSWEVPSQHWGCPCWSFVAVSYLFAHLICGQKPYFTVMSTGCWLIFMTKAPILHNHVHDVIPKSFQHSFTFLNKYVNVISIVVYALMCAWSLVYSHVPSILFSHLCLKVTVWVSPLVIGVSCSLVYTIHGLLVTPTIIAQSVHCDL